MRIETTEDAQQRVRQGERWLDDHMPDWEQRIDTTILNISNARCCVLGQLGATDQGRFVITGDFHDVKDYYNLTADDCERYGFSIKARDYVIPNYGEMNWQAMDWLTVAWRTVIQERRLAKERDADRELVGV